MVVWEQKCMGLEEIEGIDVAETSRCMLNILINGSAPVE